MQTVENTLTFNAVKLANAIEAVLDNGDRLAEDGKSLCEWERYPSAFALAVLAQEEYAKAFLLHLVGASAIPWTDDVRAILHDHKSKQLLMTVMDFLEPNDSFSEGWFKRLERQETLNHPIPAHVADAVHIIRYEKVPHEDEWAWIQGDDRPCDRAARKIADGKIDRQKQGALYVRIGKDGSAAGLPTAISRQRAEAEIEKAERLGKLLFRYQGKLTPPVGVEYEKIKWMFRVLFGLCTVEEYNGNWWAR